MWKHLSLSFAFLAVSGLAANATVVVDDWTLDLAGVDGIAAGPGSGASGIDFMTFNAKTHSRLTDNGDGVLSPGDIYTTNILGTATQLLNDAAGVIFGSGINSVWQMSFSATIDLAVTSVDPAGSFTFSHIAAGAGPSDGVLDIFVQRAAGNAAFTNAAPGNGEASYVDGVLVASFDVLPGGGGGIFLPTLDGSDDATYLLTGALPGVLLDSNGDDLSLNTLLGIIDSNVDLDPQATGLFSATGVSPWPTASPSPGVNTSVAEFFADEDGSYRLAVPEPGTLAIWASFMSVGLVIRSRRRVR